MAYQKSLLWTELLNCFCFYVFKEFIKAMHIMFSLNGPISEKSSGAGLVAVQGIFKRTGFIIFQLC